MKLEEEDLHDKLRIECWNNALHSYGTSHIFERRNSSTKLKLKWITFLGIIVPILVGAVATGYGTESDILKNVIFIVTPISIIQLVISVWSLVAKWNESSEYYTESAINNFNLSSKYVDLAKYPSKSIDELKTELEKINIEKRNRDTQDGKYSLTEKEKRRGMRYALRKFKRKCAGCNLVPKSMESTDCDICGKF